MIGAQHISCSLGIQLLNILTHKQDRVSGRQVLSTRHRLRHFRWGEGIAESELNKPYVLFGESDRGYNVKFNSFPLRTEVPAVLFVLDRKSTRLNSSHSQISY